MTSSHSSIADQKVTLVFFLGGVTFAEIAALRFLAQQDDGKSRSRYSLLSLSRSLRDSLKYFEISVPRHISFVELRKKSIEQPHFANEYYVI